MHVVAAARMGAGHLHAAAGHRVALQSTRSRTSASTVPEGLGRSQGGDIVKTSPRGSRTSSGARSWARRGSAHAPRDAGKMTARERMEALFDPGTFEELDKLVTHRCLDFACRTSSCRATASCRVTGRWTAGRCMPSRRTSPCSADRSPRPTREDLQGDGPGLAHGRAHRGLNDSGGARIQEGVMSLGGYATSSSAHAGVGVVPQISAIMGRARAARSTRRHHRLQRHGEGTSTCSSPARTSSRRHPRRRHQGRPRRA